jgi:hypothetical protein
LASQFRHTCPNGSVPLMTAGFGDSVLLIAVLEGGRCDEACNRIRRSRAERLRVSAHAAGYPPLGRAGAAVAECVRAGLAIRGASMVASGVPGPAPQFSAASLLGLELAVGVVASLAGLHPLVSARSADRPAAARTCAVESVRRAAVAILFVVHTVRFGIRLRPDRVGTS